MDKSFLSSSFCASERTAIELGDVLTDIHPDLDSALARLSELDAVSAKREKKDIFCETHAAWDKSMEARCDFQFHPRLVRRGGGYFFSIWKKSVMGRTLTDIKADEAMIPFFAEHVGAFVKEVIGGFLQGGDWCVVTTPKRRHKVRNFATLTAIRMAELLEIPFYEDVATCRSRHRVGAVFDLQQLPPERNIILYDDFVTTGSTLCSMRNVLEPNEKNVLCFTGINNKL